MPRPQSYCAPVVVVVSTPSSDGFFAGQNRPVIRDRQSPECESQAFPIPMTTAWFVRVVALTFLAGGFASCRHAHHETAAPVSGPAATNVTGKEPRVRVAKKQGRKSGNFAPARPAPATPPAAPEDPDYGKAGGRKGHEVPTRNVDAEPVKPGPVETPSPPGPPTEDTGYGKAGGRKGSNPPPTASGTPPSPEAPKNNQ
jgi:hypothetical protein